ncbi:MAG: hypothetical protein RR960_01415, partial [Alistipes sp.]
YIEILRKPLCIKESALLNSSDLSELNPVIPIYLEQHGCYCAVLKATTKDDNVVDLELLRM